MGLVGEVEQSKLRLRVVWTLFVLPQVQDALQERYIFDECIVA